MNSAEHPITEDDIANFLANTPDFFERHAELLATVQLSSGHGSRAVSLQERQAGMLRDKIKGLETRVVEMIRHGHDNAVIAAKLHHWARRLLQVARARDIPAAIIQGLQEDFQIPQAAIKVWGTGDGFDREEFCAGVSEDIRTFSASLSAPYCGINAGFEAVSWLPDAPSVQSLALIALQSATGAGSSGPVGASAGDAGVSGLLILASHDVERFQVGMGVDFLVQIGELASAALCRLQAPAAPGAL